MFSCKIIFFIFDSPFQFSGNDSRIILSPVIHSLNLCCPVPTGFLKTSSPASTAALLLIIEPFVVAKCFNKGPKGSFVVTFIVFSSICPSVKIEKD